MSSRGEIYERRQLESYKCHTCKKVKEPIEYSEFHTLMSSGFRVIAVTPDCEHDGRDGRNGRESNRVNRGSERNDWC